MEILYQGQTLDGKWIEGTPSFRDGVDYINKGGNLYAAIEIRPNTLQQFIGIIDSQKQKIFSGEIRQFYDWGGDGRKIGVATVVWDEDELGWGLEPSLGIEDRYDLRKALLLSELIQEKL